MPACLATHTSTHVPVIQVPGRHMDASHEAQQAKSNGVRALAQMLEISHCTVTLVRLRAVHA
eukprot:366007-Chlamydomonas_euryale.AAC.3